MLQLAVGGKSCPGDAPSATYALTVRDKMLASASSCVRGGVTCVRSLSRLHVFIIIAVLYSGVALFMMHIPLYAWLSRPGRHPEQHFGGINEGGEQCFSNRSVWWMLREEEVARISDAWTMGGLHAKSKVEFSGVTWKGLWKPQLKLGHGHLSSSFNEVIAFHLDCLLQLRRVPPTASRSLDVDAVTNSLSWVTRIRFWMRDAEWEQWKADGVIPGVSQQILNDVNHKFVTIVRFEERVRSLCRSGWLPFDLSLCSLGAFEEKELAHRAVFDFILGCYDRDENQFYTRDRITGAVHLLHIDNNHMHVKKPSASEQSKKLAYCRYERSFVERLRSMRGGEYDPKSMASRLYESLKREPLMAVGLSGKLRNIIHNIPLRLEMVLEHIDRCEELFGVDYVYNSWRRHHLLL